MGRQYIVYRPLDFLWVGICKNFVHAFNTWLHLHDRENWFIGPADEFRTAVNCLGKWCKLDDARPLRTDRAPYRGPLSAHDIELRRRAAEREQRRRDYKRWGLA